MRCLGCLLVQLVYKCRLDYLGLVYSRRRGYWGWHDDTIGRQLLVFCCRARSVVTIATIDLGLGTSGSGSRRGRVGRGCDVHGLAWRRRRHLYDGGFENRNCSSANWVFWTVEHMVPGCCTLGHRRHLSIEFLTVSNWHVRFETIGGVSLRTKVELILPAGLGSPAGWARSTECAWCWRKSTRENEY